MPYEKQKDVLSDFLKRWDYSAINNLKFDEYIYSKSNDSFTYWLEEITGPWLGGIDGYITKFWLYKQSKVTPKIGKGFKKSKTGNYVYRDRFSDEIDTFNHIKKSILEILKAISINSIATISTIDLPCMLKWKIAFLYQFQKNITASISILPIASHDRLLKYLKNQKYWNMGQATDMLSLYTLAITKESINNFDDAFDFTSKVFPAHPLNLITTIFNKSQKISKRRKLPEGVRRYDEKEYSTFHYEIQTGLKTYLEKKYGKNNVWVECPISKQSRVAIDIKSLENGDYIYYEIKPYPDVRACIREALGQLLEYMYYNKDINAQAIKTELPKKLIVVGKEQLNKESELYLDILNKVYKLPIEYKQFDLILKKLR